MSMTDFYTVWKIPIRMVANKLGMDILRTSLGVSHIDELFMMWRVEVNFYPI